MNTKILRLDSSLFGAQGASTQLNAALVEQLKQQYPDARVTHRDLAAEPLPYVTAAFIQALGKEDAERTAEETAQVRLSNQLIQELQEADAVVVGAPMYNFTVPSTLKTWMDHVARAGTTFEYTSEGAVGLLSNKRIYISASRGGLHKDQATDNVVPLLKHFFQLLGLTDVQVIYAEGLNMGGESRGKAFAEARRVIGAIAA